MMSPSDRRLARSFLAFQNLLVLFLLVLFCLTVAYAVERSETNRAGTCGYVPFVQHASLTDQFNSNRPQFRDLVSSDVSNAPVITLGDDSGIFVTTLHVTYAVQAVSTSGRHLNIVSTASLTRERVQIREDDRFAHPLITVTCEPASSRASSVIIRLNATQRKHLPSSWLHADISPK